MTHWVQSDGTAPANTYAEGMGTPRPLGGGCSSYVLRSGTHQSTGRERRQEVNKIEVMEWDKILFWERFKLSAPVYFQGNWPHCISLHVFEPCPILAILFNGEISSFDKSYCNLKEHNRFGTWSITTTLPLAISYIQIVPTIAASTIFILHSATSKFCQDNKALQVPIPKNLLLGRTEGGTYFFALCGVLNG